VRTPKLLVALPVAVAILAAPASASSHCSAFWEIAHLDFHPFDRSDYGEGTALLRYDASVFTTTFVEPFFNDDGHGTFTITHEWQIGGETVTFVEDAGPTLLGGTVTTVDSDVTVQAPHDGTLRYDGISRSDGAGSEEARFSVTGELGVSP